jgi:hypothetical protein
VSSQRFCDACKPGRWVDLLPAYSIQMFNTIPKWYSTDDNCQPLLDLCGRTNELTRHVRCHKLDVIRVRLVSCPSVNIETVTREFVVVKVANITSRSAANAWCTYIYIYLYVRCCKHFSVQRPQPMTFVCRLQWFSCCSAIYNVLFYM